MIELNEGLQGLSVAHQAGHDAFPVYVLDGALLSCCLTRHLREKHGLLQLWTISGKQACSLSCRQAYFAAEVSCTAIFVSTQRGMWSTSNQHTVTHEQTLRTQSLFPKNMGKFGLL